MGDTGGVGGEPGIGGERLGPEDGEQCAELAIVADGEDELALAGREGPVRDDAEVPVAHPARYNAAGGVGRGLVDQPREQ
jgi:hypothetical protein